MPCPISGGFWVAIMRERGVFPDVMLVATHSRGKGGCQLHSFMGVNEGMLGFSSREGRRQGVAVGFRIPLPTCDSPVVVL